MRVFRVSVFFCVPHTLSFGNYLLINSSLCVYLCSYHDTRTCTKFFPTKKQVGDSLFLVTDYCWVYLWYQDQEGLHQWPEYTLLLRELPRTTLIARFMGPTWGPAGADRTQVGPMLAPWTLLSGTVCRPLSEFIVVQSCHRCYIVIKCGQRYHYSFGYMHKNGEWWYIMPRFLS